MHTPAHTNAKQDTQIGAAEEATQEDFQDHISNLLDVITSLDGLVTQWKKDYDKLDDELTDAKKELEAAQTAADEP